VKLQGTRSLALPLALAWRRLADPAVIQACTPGLERLEETEPDHFEAVLEIKLPAMTGRFTGSIEFLERTPEERLRMRVRGKGPAGFVDGEATLALAAAHSATAHSATADSATAEGATTVSWSADVAVGGQVARLGQRMISGVAKEMAGQFFDALERVGSEAAGATGGAASARAPSAALPPWRAALQLAWRTLLRLLGLRRD
jgi:carbon monoxide dehydrogenase subunit G